MNNIQNVFLLILHENNLAKKAINISEIINAADEVLKKDMFSPWHAFDIDRKKEFLNESLKSEYFTQNGVSYDGKICKVKSLDDIANDIVKENEVNLVQLLDEIQILDEVIDIEDLFDSLLINNVGFNIFNQDIYINEIKLKVFHILLSKNDNLSKFEINQKYYIYNNKNLSHKTDDILFYIIDLLKNQKPISFGDLYKEIMLNPYYFALLNIKTKSSSKTEKDVLREIIKFSNLIKKTNGKLTLDNDLKALLNTQSNISLSKNIDVLEKITETLMINKKGMNINSIIKELSIVYNDLSKEIITKELNLISEDDLYKKYSIHTYTVDNDKYYIHKNNCEYITDNADYMLEYVRDSMEEFLKEEEKSFIYPISNHLKKKFLEEFKDLTLSSILINDLIKRVVMEMLNRDLSIDNLKIDLDRKSIEFMIDNKTEPKNKYYYGEHPLSKSLKAYVKNELMTLSDKKNHSLRTIEELTLYDEDNIKKYYQYHNNLDKVIKELKTLDGIS